MSNQFSKVYEELFDAINTAVGGAPTQRGIELAYDSIVTAGKSVAETTDFIASEAKTTEGIVAVEPSERIAAALDVAYMYQGIDGENHKDWVIDQMCRVLAGPEYREFVTVFCDGEDGPDTYEWPVGIAP